MESSAQSRRLAPLHPRHWHRPPLRPPALQSRPALRQAALQSRPLPSQEEHPSRRLRQRAPSPLGPNRVPNQRPDYPRLRRQPGDPSPQLPRCHFPPRPEPNTGTRRTAASPAKEMTRAAPRREQKHETGRGVECRAGGAEAKKTSTGQTVRGPRDVTRPQAEPTRQLSVRQVLTARPPPVDEFVAYGSRNAFHSASEPKPLSAARPFVPGSGTLIA